MACGKAHPMCRRATLALTHLSGSLLRCQQCSAKKLARGFALSFRRECFSIHDISFVAAEGLPSRKPCKLSGSLTDELVLVSVLAPLYSAARRLSSTPQMRVQVGAELLSAKTSGAPCTICPKSSTRAPRPPIPCSLTRQTKQPGILSLRAFFSFVFKAHNINLLETASALSLLRHLASEGHQNCRILALTDSRVAVLAFSKSRSSSRRVKNLLRKVAALCLCYGFQFDIVWVPMWGNPADAPSWVQPLSPWRKALQRLSPQSQASLCIKPQSIGSLA